MPRYDYRCTDCGNDFELTQSFSEAGTGTCPVCEGAGRRVFHAVPVIYKGSGFYTTDYGRPKPPNEDGSKQETDGKASKTESSDGDSSTKDAKAPDKETASSSASSADTPATTSSNSGTCRQG